MENTDTTFVIREKPIFQHQKKEYSHLRACLLKKYDSPTREFYFFQPEITLPLHTKLNDCMLLSCWGYPVFQSPLLSLSLSKAEGGKKSHQGEEPLAGALIWFNSLTIPRAEALLGNFQTQDNGTPLATEFHPPGFKCFPIHSVGCWAMDFKSSQGVKAVPKPNFQPPPSSPYCSYQLSEWGRWELWNPHGQDLRLGKLSLPSSQPPGI